MEKEVSLRFSLDEYDRIPNKLETEKDFSEIALLHWNEKEPFVSYRVLKKSIDARRKSNIRIEIKLLLLDYEASVIPTVRQVPSYFEPKNRPVVVGFGPSGIFAALLLAREGLCPIIFERGEKMDKRIGDVARSFTDGVVLSSSNVQFGEGGAGAFSDGKLYSGIKNKRKSVVLEEFVRAGAPPEILYESHPHIGTDRIRAAVQEIRREIEGLGGSFFFSSKVTGFSEEKGKISGLFYQSAAEDKTQYLSCKNVILAIGHSARDTFSFLLEMGIQMEKKPFSVGVRIEHKQGMIDFSQYGESCGHPSLFPAEYKLVSRTPTGRSLYTFCMCPGGYVIASSSEEKSIVTNGMSYYRRNGENANSAILVGVSPEDMPGDVLSGVAFQEKLEKAAFVLGGGNGYAPCQRVEDFLKDRASLSAGTIQPTYQPGVTFTNIRSLFPEYINQTLAFGIKDMDKRLAGFSFGDALLTAVETRSSSPLRIVRDENFQSVSISGLYPCGEGAGYAGGIMSSAIDGMMCAEYIVKIASENPEEM